MLSYINQLMALFNSLELDYDVDNVLTFTYTNFDGKLVWRASNDFIDKYKIQSNSVYGSTLEEATERLLEVLKNQRVNWKRGVAYAIC